MKSNESTFAANSLGDAIGDSFEEFIYTTEYRVAPLDWWRAVIDLGAGSNHGLRIGVISCSNGELVEIFGELPKLLKRKLKRCVGRSKQDYAIEWLTRPDCKGTRYELEGLSHLLRLLEERAELISGGAK